MSNALTFGLYKLVRDGIRAGHIEEGCTVDGEVLDDDTRFAAELRRKLPEEEAELAAAETDEEKAKEQRDINDVLFALGELSVDSYHPTNTFNERYFIKTVTVPETSWLYKYYQGDPKKYPVVQA